MIPWSGPPYQVPLTQPPLIPVAGVHWRVSDPLLPRMMLNVLVLGEVVVTV